MPHAHPKSSPSPHPTQKLVAGTWNLAATEAAPAEEAFGLQNRPHGAGEAILNTDNRTVVTPADFGPNGKYRCVVKLQLRFEKQHNDDHRWAMASGWLIRPDIIVTAGHCAYDWTPHAPMGRVTHVKAYIGYRGKDSMHHPDVQFRHVKKVVTTADWLASGKHEAYDLAFFQVDQPFSGVKPFQFLSTPVQGSDLIGVVGYPADKRFYNSAAGELGGEMWEGFGKIQWDLPKSKMHTLDYPLSTYPGESGSPVIKKGTNVVVGVHVYGGESVNSASAIGGRFGNDFHAYLEVFDKKPAVVKTTNNIEYVGLTASKTEASEASEAEDAGNAEDGWADIIKAFVGTAPKAAWRKQHHGSADGAATESGGLEFGTRGEGPAGLLTASWPEDSLEDDVSPFAGVISSHISAIAGGILAAATITPSTESATSMKADPAAHFDRALLAEAALQAVFNMDAKLVKSSGIHEHMKAVYAKAAYKTPRLPSAIVPLIIERGLRIASYHANKCYAKGATKTGRFESTMDEDAADESSIAEELSGSDNGTKAFVRGLLQASSSPSQTEAAGDERWIRTAARGAAKGASYGADAASIWSAFHEDAMPAGDERGWGAVARGAGHAFGHGQDVVSIWNAVHGEDAMPAGDERGWGRAARGAGRALGAAGDAASIWSAFRGEDAMPTGDERGWRAAGRGAGHALGAAGDATSIWSALHGEDAMPTTGEEKGFGGRGIGIGGLIFDIYDAVRGRREDAMPGEEDQTGAQPVEGALARPLPSGMPRIHVHVHNICRRALLAEGPLQALIKHSETATQDEAFFQDIKHVMQDIGGEVKHLSHRLVQPLRLAIHKCHQNKTAQQTKMPQQTNPPQQIKPPQQTKPAQQTIPPQQIKEPQQLKVPQQTKTPEQIRTLKPITPEQIRTLKPKIKPESYNAHVSDEPNGTAEASTNGLEADPSKGMSFGEYLSNGNTEGSVERSGQWGYPYYRHGHGPVVFN